MVPSGPPTPIGGPQSVNHSLLRTNSGLLGGSQQGSIPSQSPFPSLVPPRTQFNGSGLLGNISNVSSLLNHSLANGAPAAVGGLPAPPVNIPPRGGLGGVDMITPADVDPLLFASSQAQGQQHFQSHLNSQLGPSQPETQQLETMQNMQKQFPALQSQQQQQQHRDGLSNMGAMGQVKMEPQMVSGDQNGPIQQLQSLGSIGAVKMEPQQLQALRSLGPVKMEPQHSETSLLMQQQQQQHQQILLRQNSQTAAAQMSLLQQQRLLHLHQQQQQRQQQLQQQQQHIQQHQQQQMQQQQQQQMQQQQQQQQQHMMKNLSQQRIHLQHQNNLVVRSPVQPNIYEPGTCARRLTHYVYHQQHRPEDNNIEFWRKFVAEYFAPNAKKRWCVSLYGNGRQTTGVFPQDVWHCEICNRKPGRGFETTVEVLPRLFQIKYASGTLEELLYVDMPREYQNASGQIVLDYAKAIQESVFEQLRVTRDGQLRIVFNPDLKIASWEFCARRHEELIPRRLIIPQVSQLGAVVQKYQTAAQSQSSGSSTQDLQSTCNSFVTSARQLAKSLEVPLVNDLGYSKRYVRCLQISEVVNCMKDLVDYSRETGTGPMDSLVNFPRRTSSSSGIHTHSPQQPEDPQNANPASYNNDQSSVHGSSAQPVVSSNGMVTEPLNAASTSTSATNITGLLHQTSMSVRHENQTVNNPYGRTNSMQIPSVNASNSLAPTQQSPSSTFASQISSTSNDNPLPNSHNPIHFSSTNSLVSLSTMQQPTAQLHEADPMDSQNSVQQILQEMMRSSQVNGMNSLGNDTKGINGVPQGLNGGMHLVGNGISTNHINFTGIGGLNPSATTTAIKEAMSNNIFPVNGRIGIGQLSQNPTAISRHQHDMGNRPLDGLGSVNNFNNIQFDWKPS